MNTDRACKADQIMRVVSGRTPHLGKVLTFAVHERDDQHVSEAIASNGEWEPFETDLVRRMIAALPTGVAPVFVDCGANLGWYSVLAASFGAEVVAFEPMPANADLLRFNLATNGLPPTWRVFETALGETCGEAELHLSETNQGDHRVHAAKVSDPRKQRRTISVEVESLDSVWTNEGLPRPHVVKLDTQGSEVAILRGGRHVWASRPDVHDVALVTEFWPYGLTRCGASAQEFLDLLSPLIDVTHVCLEVQEWASALVRRSATDLTEIASSPGLSLEVRGFTNLAFIPNELFDRL